MRGVQIQQWTVVRCAHRCSIDICSVYLLTGLFSLNVLTTGKHKSKQGQQTYEVAFGDMPQAVLSKPSLRAEIQWFTTQAIKSAVVKVLQCFIMHCYEQVSK